jgi:adenylylsulfate kinase-like enzyme
VEECERRDVKGLYAKARAGEIPEFTGVSDPYEEPVEPELRLDTTTLSPKESVQLVIAKLEELGCLGVPA